MVQHSATLGGQFAIALAILRLAKAQESCALQLKYLGNGDAATTMGAIEALGMHIGEKIDSFGTLVSEAIESVGDALAGRDS